MAMAASLTAGKAAATSVPAATTISRGPSTAISSFSARRASAPAYSATWNSPVVRSSNATPSRCSLPDGPSRPETASRNDGSRASRYDASASVPGVITRTTSRLTTPLAFFGSSICSQMATRWPCFTSRVM